MEKPGDLVQLDTMDLRPSPNLVLTNLLDEYTTKPTRFLLWYNRAAILSKQC